DTAPHRGAGTGGSGWWLRAAPDRQGRRRSVDEQADGIGLGMGPGGEEVAGQAAAAGLSVVGIEERLLGGECPYFACVPTKMMVRGADLLAEGRRIPGMAGDAAVSPDWTPVARRIRDDATDNCDAKVAVDRFE